MPTVIDLDLLDSIAIRWHRYGELRLRPLTLDAIEFIEPLIGTNIPAREFTSCVLHHLLVKPRLDLEAVQGWPDRLLCRVAISWLVENDQLIWQPLPDESSFDAFRRILTDDIEGRKHELLNAMLAPLRDIGADSSRLLTEGVIAQFRELSFADTMIASIGEQLRGTYQRQLEGMVQAVQASTLGFQSHIGQILKGLNVDFTAQIAHQFAAMSQSISVQRLLEHIRPELLVSVNASAAALAGSIHHIEQSLQDVLQSVAVSRFPVFSPGGLFPTLPNVSEMLSQWLQFTGDARAGNMALGTAGFGFTTHLWTISFVVSLARVSPQVRSAVITKRLADYTRSDEFERDLASLFANSRVIQKRWPAVWVGLVEHQQHNYVASTRVLMPEVEGIVRDMMIFNGLAQRRGKKVYAKDGLGNFKLDKHGKPVRLSGLSNLIDHSDFQDHEVLCTLGQVVKNQFAPDRNVILHGERVDYETAKRSTLTLLLLFVLATEFGAFEGG